MLLTLRRLPALCAIVTLCLTAPSSAQSPQNTAASPFEAASRALNRGQFDEVATLLRDSTDPRAIALRARAEIARGRYARGRETAGGSRRLGARERRGARARVATDALGRRADATRTLQGVLPRSPQNTPQDLTRLGLAARALGRLPGGERLLPRRQRAGARRCGGEHRVGRAVPREIQPRRRDEVVPGRAAHRPGLRAGARRPCARHARGEPAGRADRRSSARSQTNPNYVPAHLFVAELALDDRKRDEARESIAKALEVNPNSLEARSLDGAMAFLEGRTADFEARAAERSQDQPDLRRRVPHGGRAPRAQLPLRRSGGADAPGASRSTARAPASYADLGLHLLRTGDEPGARRALETAFKADPYDVVTYNLLAMLDPLDKFVTITDGDVVMRLHPDEAAVMREFAMPLAQQALATLSKQYQFKPTGPDPHRDVPEARRLRRAHARAARVHRRARRLLRPRRHARFAEGAAAGAVHLGRDAVARDGARHHAADVAEPPAAVADRGHLGVRGAACAPELGTGGPPLVRAGARRGQDAEARRPQRGVQRSAPRSRSPTTRRRSSSST